MIQVEFCYNNTVTLYEADLYSPFQYVFDIFVQRYLLDKNSVYFTFNGEIIDPMETIISKIKNINIQNNKIQILVYSKNDNQGYNSYSYWSQISSNNNQNNYPSYEGLTVTNENSMKCSNTLTSVSSVNDTSYQSVNSFNPPYNSKLNEFTIIYKIQKTAKKIRLFSNYFVKTNKNRCYILLNGNKINLCEELQLNDNLKKKDTLEIKLIEVEPITDMSDIFRKVSELLSLPDISNLNTSNITKMRFMFDQCVSLTYLPPFLNWNTSSVTEMSEFLIIVLN